jgi:mevalonate kinase
MKKISKVSAPAKLILSGEHSVVYGYPALTTAINKRLIASLNKKKIKIVSEILVGVGMGSSAAFAVATSALKLGKLEPEKINGMAYIMEKKRHGAPSGADNTVCTYGGFLWYRKESENLKIFKTITPKKKFPKIFLLNTGKPAETTREMVESVSDRYLTRKAYYDIVFRKMELVTRNFLEFLIGNSVLEFGLLIRENEKLLEELGVVSESTKKIIRRIENIGGAAKISGAGGRKNESGIVIVYHKDPKKLLNFAKKNNLDLFSVKMGEEGVRIEK